VDDKQLIAELGGLATVPRPLGFDPDDVATKAAKRIQTRRMAVGAGLTTLAVIGAVAVVVPRLSAPKQAPVGQAPASTTSPAPADPGTAQREVARQHLLKVLPSLVPGAKDIQAPAFPPGDAPDMTTGAVTFQDSAGPAYFTFTISGAAGSKVSMKPLKSWCPAHPADPQLGPDGKPLRCDNLRQPDGSTVVLMESGSPGPSGRVSKIDELDALHYRNDGSVVSAIDGEFLTATLAMKYGFTDADGNPKESRPRYPLTEQQLIGLVTDPGFVLK
jgi:hypothetical protein